MSQETQLPPPSQTPAQTDQSAQPTHSSLPQSTPPSSQTPSASPPPSEDPDLKDALQEFRQRRAQAIAQREQEARQAAARPDVLSDLPNLLQREYGLSPEDAKLAIYHGVYALNPDAPNIPVDFKLTLHERKQARAMEAATAQREAEAKEQYQYMLSMQARAAKEDAFPASVDWYDGDHARYARALEKTALQMAAAAQQSGVWADLSPQAVQAEHERQLASRLTKVTQKRQAKAAPAQPEAQATPQVPQKTTPTVASSVGATSGNTVVARKTRAEADKAADELIARLLAG